MTEGAARGPSELTLRWLSASVLIPGVLLLCYAGGLIFVATVAIIAAIGMHEYQELALAKGVHPQRALGLAGAFALPFLVHAGSPGLLAGFTTALVLASLAVQLGAGRSDGALASPASTVFGVFYVSWLLSHAVSLRFAARDPQLADAGLDPLAGFFLIVFAMGAAVGSDAGGFFVGRRFGRRKLAPRISPGKTVEGALGAIGSGAVIGAVILAIFRVLAPGWTAGLSLGAAVAVATAIAGVAIAGDLIESLFKRDAGRKDAGHIIPGIGGVLDRFDSSLLALPVLYYALLGYHALG
jgi:phosphatidate cytidylyltransferase